MDREGGGSLPFNCIVVSTLHQIYHSQLELIGSYEFHLDLLYFLTIIDRHFVTFTIVIASLH